MAFSFIFYRIVCLFFKFILVAWFNYLAVSEGVLLRVQGKADQIWCRTDGRCQFRVPGKTSFWSIAQTWGWKLEKKVNKVRFLWEPRKVCRQRSEHFSGRRAIADNGMRNTTLHCGACYYSVAFSIYFIYLSVYFRRCKTVFSSRGLLRVVHVSNVHAPVDY